MSLKILIELRDAEEDYEEVYQREYHFKDDYAYKLITRAQDRVFKARKRLSQYSLLHSMNIPHSTIESIMSHL
jgi:hypothetical protein